MTSTPTARWKPTIATLALLLAASSSSCSSTSSADSETAGSDDSGTDDPATGSTTKKKDAGSSTIDEEEQVGSVLFYEVDPGTAMSANFSRPFTSPKTCAERTLDGCTIVPDAVCDSPCGGGKFCYWTTGCNTVCSEPLGGIKCGPGDSYAVSDEGVWSCQKTFDVLDAGTLSITKDGDTLEATLADDYYMRGKTFAFGLEETYAVNATGSDEVSAFNGTFTTPAALGSDVASLTSSALTSSGALDVAWQPGADRITVQLNGDAASALCDAKDKAGSFTASAKVLDAVRGASPTHLSLYVSRTRVTTVKNVRISAGSSKKTGVVSIRAFVSESKTVTKE